MTLDDTDYFVLLLQLTAACRWTESLKGFISLSYVSNRDVTPVSRMSVSSDAAVMSTSLKSVWKLFFFFQRKKDYRELTWNLDQRFDLVICERGLFGHSVKSESVVGIVTMDVRFVLQSIRKVERHSDRCRNVRLDTRWGNDSEVSALFSIRETWVNASALDETWDMKQLCTRRAAIKMCRLVCRPWFSTGSHKLCSKLQEV